MQQVSVLPISTAKGTDYKEESQSSLMGGNNSKDSFSAMVEKEINNEASATKTDQKSQASNSDAKNNAAESNNAKDDLMSKKAGEKSIDDNADGKNGRVEAKNEEALAQKNKSNGKSAVDEAILASEKNIDEQAIKSDAEVTDFNQSQQFLSLLYSADATLVDTKLSDAEKALMLKEGDSSNQDKTSLALKNKQALQNLLLTDQEKRAKALQGDLVQKLGEGENLSEKDGLSSFALNKVTQDLLSQELSQELTSKKNIDKKQSEGEFISANEQAIAIDTLLPIEENYDDIASMTGAIDKMTQGKVSDGANAVLNSIDKASQVKQKLEQSIQIDTLKSEQAIDAELASFLATQSGAMASEGLDNAQKSINPQASQINNIEKLSKVSENVKLSDAEKLLANALANSLDNELVKEGNQLNDDVANNTLAKEFSAQVSSLKQAEIQKSQDNKQKAANNTNPILTDLNTSNHEDSSAQLDNLSLNVADTTGEVKPNVVDGQKNDLTHEKLAFGKISSDISTIATLATEKAEQQSAEALNHNIVSDVAHIQKNNVSLQQETISIFRKDFADAVKEKIMVMISQKLQQFDIKLDPPELGNVHVRVNLQGEQAVVNFIVQNQQAKEAFDQNMGKLRDVLAEQGVDVGDANVEQQSQQASNGDEESSSQGANGKNGTGFSDEEMSMSDGFMSLSSDKNSASGVDFYA